MTEPDTIAFQNLEGKQSLKKADFNCDLHVFKLGEQLSDLPKLPTVCLLVSDDSISSTALSGLIETLVFIGCKFFMTWGNASDKIHDALDEVLESRGGDYLSVVTASHNGEPSADLAWFLINAALPSETKMRCCIGYPAGAIGVDELLENVRAAIHSRIDR